MWVLTVIFFFFDLTIKKLYLVESCLVAMGPGKGAAESKEDHTCVFEKLRDNLNATTSSFNGLPKAFSFVSRAYGGKLCDFYLCKEIYFSRSNFIENSNVHIMDNPERRTNFGLLAGNSHQHPYFGLSCNFHLLKKPFKHATNAVKKSKSITWTKLGWRKKLLN